ncbi:MAG: NADH-quinone oxidoreductase subunit NuoE [Rubrivivax sp.]|nr:NADH-quinone oxidoreductase subunit NuoE [Rubrivivax sp.]
MTPPDALSGPELAEIEAALAHVPHPHGAAIDALLIVQRHRGWVSDDSLLAIASRLEMSPDELDGIATFYNLIFRQPVGARVILLCKSVSCWIRGCDAVEQRLQQALGIVAGQTTGDGRYTLLPVACLGACDRAPVMMVGESLHTHLDGADIDQLLGGGEP